MIALLCSPSGATIDAIMQVTKWQQHSVRGFLAAVVRKKLGFDLGLEAGEGGRIYRIKVNARLTAVRQHKACGLIRCGGHSKVARPAMASLEDEIAHLRGLDLKVLRSRWQSVTGREAPSHLSRQLLFSMIAYRIQAEALGDLDAVTLRLLKKIGSNHSRP